MTKAEEVVNALYVPRIGDRVTFAPTTKRYFGTIVAVAPDGIYCRVKHEDASWFYDCDLGEVTLVEG